MKNLRASGRRVPPTQSYPTRIQITPNRPLIPIGEKFGRWRVIENGLYQRGESYFRRACRCRCECGNEAVVMCCHLKSGHSKSCGCLVLDNAKKERERHPFFAIGTKIGRWTVIENDLVRTFPTQTQRACRVRCECGTEAVRTYGELRCGRSPSCGCKSKERSIEAVWKQFYAKFRREWDCHLTLPQVKALVQLPCVYCGKEPSNRFRVRYKVDGRYQRGVEPSLELLTNGLDRVDSTKGYVLGNVVPCCFECNRMKSNHPISHWFSLMERIRSYNSSPEKVAGTAISLLLSANCASGVDPTQPRDRIGG